MALGHPKQTAQKWYRIPSTVAEPGSNEHPEDGKRAAMIKSVHRERGPGIRGITGGPVLVIDLE